MSEEKNNILAEEEPPVCDCFYVDEHEEPMSDFMRGYILAKTGRHSVSDSVMVVDYYCYGAGPEREICHCNGDRAQCDFYWPNGTSKLIFNEDGSKKYI